MTALSPAAEAMVRKRIADRAFNISGLLGLLADLHIVRDERASQVADFMSLLDDLTEEGEK